LPLATLVKHIPLHTPTQPPCPHPLPYSAGNAFAENRRLTPDALRTHLHTHPTPSTLPPPLHHAPNPPLCTPKHSHPLPTHPHERTLRPTAQKWSPSQTHMLPCMQHPHFKAIAAQQHNEVLSQRRCKWVEGSPSGATFYMPPGPCSPSDAEVPHPYAHGHTMACLCTHSF